MKTTLAVLTLLLLLPACRRTESTDVLRSTQHPDLSELAQIAAQNVDAAGRAIQVTNIALHKEEGRRVWHVGVLTWDGRDVPPPEVAAKIRDDFAKYSDAPVVFEKGVMLNGSIGHLMPKSPN